MREHYGTKRISSREQTADGLDDQLHLHPQGDLPRELISNASDAIDKLYYRTLEDGATGLSREDFFIRIDLDKDARTLTITDNGVGMTQEELDNNLGVIAKSGSLQFKQEAEQKEDVTSSASSAWGSTPRSWSATR